MHARLCMFQVFPSIKPQIQLLPLFFNVDLSWNVDYKTLSGRHCTTMSAVAHICLERSAHQTSLSMRNLLSGSQSALY